MRDKISDAQWAAGRAMGEGEAPTHARIAACMGVHTTTVSHRAAEFGWKTLDFRHPRVRAAHRALIAVSAAAKAGHVLDPLSLDAGKDEAASDAIADASGGYAMLRGAADAPLPDLPHLPPGPRAARLRAMITARLELLVRAAEAGRPIEVRQVAALTALAQLAERIAPFSGEEETRDMESRSDAELAEILAKIDGRIVELGTDYAAHLLVKAGMDEATVKTALEQAAVFT